MTIAATRTRQQTLFPEAKQPELPEGLKGIPITQGRCVLPFQMFCGRAVSENGLIIAAYLDNTAGQSGYANWQTDVQIAKGSKLPLRTAQKGIEELKTKGFLHPDRQAFRGKQRRVLFMLWKVPETLPRLDGEQLAPDPKDRADSGAKDRADSGASKPSHRADSGALTAPIPAHPYPISNPGLSSKGETGTVHAPAHTREGPVSTAAREPVPEATGPPPSPSARSSPPAELPPSPEQIARWHEQAERPGRDQVVARIMLAGLAPRPLSPHAQARMSREANPSTATSRASPSVLDRALDLAAALREPDRPDSVGTLVAFLCNRLEAGKAETIDFYTRAFAAARSGEIPLEGEHGIYRALSDTFRPSVKKPGKPKFLSACLGNAWRAAKKTAAAGLA